jgi:hypothetical protein
MSATTIRILVNGARGTQRRGPGWCKGCGNRIFWCATELRKPIPFDVHPEVIALQGDVEVVSAAEVHWRTCEKREQFRKTGPEKPAASAPVAASLFE